MGIYTVHVPDAASDALTRGERTVFVREGFSLRAFAFGLFFLLWHRLWVAAATYAVGLLALAAFAVLVHPPTACIVALAGLMHLYLGAEGPDLRRWGLARRGFVMRDLVSAPGLAAAETVFFTRQPEALRPEPAAAPAARWMAPPPGPAVIGVFPEGGTP